MTSLSVPDCWGETKSAGSQVRLLKNSNVTVPVGVLTPGVPVTKAWSRSVVGYATVLLLVRAAPLWEGTWVAMPAWQGWDAPPTKSFSTAVMDCEERVSIRKLAKHSPPRLNAVRFRPPSKKATGA